ncbi:MAG: 30S ribosomal protein S14 [Proteobacteria bacterium]|jgi:small subunit ribosomal protein S14|nr:30S ribosomal protein S14 [Pseudomonadota bacterium]
MAKKGRIERNNKVLGTIQKDAEKRASLTFVLKSATSTHDEKFAVMIALQKVSRDGSATRYRNRCALTGRPRGYYSKFGLSRNMIRHYASFGQISGLKKSSW